MFHEFSHYSPGIFQCQRSPCPDATRLQRFVPPFDLAIRLRIIWARSNVTHPADSDVLLEITSNKLRTIIRDDPRPRLGELFLSPLDDHLDITLLHLFSQFPVHD